jgi:hypothetical protein
MSFEIQMLNSTGQALGSGYVDDKTANLQIHGRGIPLPVIEAARRQPTGKGDYVDESGKSVPHF